jgi:hypothetical protein
MQDQADRVLRRALSRREVLQWAGAGAAGAVIASLTAGSAWAAATPLERLLPGVRVLSQPPRLQSVGDALPDLQLPFWGDGASWNQPQYYETIQAGTRRKPKTRQSADIDGDGQDELIARSAAGILVHRFNPDVGQWVPLPNGPPWADANGWDQPQYYETIQTADIDGDGRAELLARGAGGITVWKFTTENSWVQLPDGPAWADDGSWDQPQYYTTIQCADIDGDGRAELLARGAGGITVWKFTAENSWMQLPDGPPWADANGWDHPQYYETIQCADFLLPGDPGYAGDGTHKQAVLLARGADGIQIWRCTGAFQGWELLAAHNPEWSDYWNWDYPQYYRTIQTADIDGDGRAELLGRGSTGIAVAKFYPASRTWNSLPGLPGFADAPGGWVPPEYYTTIQTADMDGDGQAEVLARDACGIIAFQYEGASQGWKELQRGPNWNDAGGWNQVHYYSTIQTARVNVSTFNLNGGLSNPNNPPTPEGKPVAALLGRDSLSLKTWRFQGGATPSWSQTSAPFPQFTGAQLTAYQYINQNLFGIDPNQDLRAQYASVGAQGATDWMIQLQGWKTSAPPSDVNVPAADWLAVVNQIFDEVRLVANVAANLTTTNDNLLADITIEGGILDQVDEQLKASLTSNAVAVTVIQILAGAAVAVSALAAPPLALVAGLLAAGSIGLTLMPDSGEPLELEFDELKAQLLNTFENARAGNMQAARATKQDYGLLGVLGKDIFTDVPPSVDEAVTNSYAKFVGQHLTPMVWRVGLYNPPPRTDPDNTYVVYVDKGSWGYWKLFELRQAYRAFPPGAALQYLFDPPPGGLGLSAREAMEDWQFKCVSYIVPDECPPQLPGLPSTPRVDMAVTLTRDSATGGVWARLRLTNTGNAHLPNVEITSARLRGRAPVTALPTPRIRLAHRRTHDVLLYFPAAVGGPGTRNVLQIRGTYLGGAFGTSLRVTLP